MNHHGFREAIDTIKIQVKVDSLPLFNNNSTEFYPLLGLCQDFNYNENDPFCIAVFSGVGKPDPIDDFLFNFIQEVEKLSKHGIQFNSSHYKFATDCFV